MTQARLTCADIFSCTYLLIPIYTYAPMYVCKYVVMQPYSHVLIYICCPMARIRVQICQSTYMSISEYANMYLFTYLLI